ncbi:NAD-dependent epimerase/dehydratase family protein [Hansschlegelia plantiphila]|uniref:Oxidoreductase n=1 Tax=Hansschlegelia plantiphila TaxID=374655 RepID=A0A9W6J3U0_9HYPH|nr:NAD(P)-dependent oxidoreductase [Hansschlegelia plantiphila]GLK68834.1 oxidoreductase [Hansschlegelia plantiphila]
MTEPGPALVTGAAGFIGSGVAAALAARVPVRAAYRNTPLPAALLDDRRIEPVRCDLDDPAEVRAAVAGASLVVHAAYGPDAAMAPQCVRLLDAMSAEGVSALIYLSSIAVYGERSGVVDETAAPLGALGAYAQAKRACEALVRDWADAAPGRRALILRPGVVYGAGSRFWIDKMAERIRLGAWGSFGPAGEGVAPLVHVDDVVALIAQASRRLSDDAFRGAPALNVIGPETPSWNAYFARLADALGAPPLRELSPATIAARRAFAVPAKLWRRLGLPGLRSTALAPASGEITLFALRASYPTDAAAGLLGFTPAIGLDEGLRRSLR